MNKPTAVFVEGQDELTRIPGIGEKVAQRLIQAGIDRYDQLALMSDEEILAILNQPKLPGWNLAHVQEMRWPEQAARLAAEQRERNPIPAYDAPAADNDPGEIGFVPLKEVANLDETEDQTDRQHYATFTVRLLVGEQGVIRRTKVEHVETGTPNTWSGFDGDRLLAFVRKHSLSELTASQDKMDSPDPISANELPSIPSGSVMLGAVEIETPRGEGAKGLAPHDQPFTIAVLFNLSAVKPRDEGMGYRLSVYAHKVGEDIHRQLIAHTAGISPAQDQFLVHTDQITLPHGVYHLDALAQLTHADKPEEPILGLFAMTEGYRLTVY